jgi:hypothetical protein
MYSHGSETRLATCDIGLQKIFRAVLRIIDHKILEGVRGKEDQEAAFVAGKSTVHWPMGNHNVLNETDLCKAVDAAAYPLDWENFYLHCYFAGIVMGVAAYMGIPLRWGGDWRGDQSQIRAQFKEKGRLNDLVHFELADE